MGDTEDVDTDALLSLAVSHRGHPGAVPVSAWTHAICEPCWVALRGDELPARIVESMREPERCCRCQYDTRSGIYLREHPDTFPCAGVHELHPDTTPEPSP